MRIRTISFLMALSAMLILGTTPNSESKTLQERWGKLLEGFRLSAHPWSVQAKVDQPVLLRLTIKNVTKRDLEVREALPRREYEIDVRNSRGETVPLTDFGQQLLENRWLGFRVRDIKVEPGEERQDTVDIAKLRDLSVPGTYYVKAKRRIKKRNGKGWGEVASNMVRVTIVK
jgi:hypothetical protein